MGRSMVKPGSFLETALRGGMTIAEAADRADEARERTILERAAADGPSCQGCGIPMDWTPPTELHYRDGRTVVLGAEWCCDCCGFVMDA